MRAIPTACTSLARPSIVSANALRRPTRPRTTDSPGPPLSPLADMTVGRKAPIRKVPHHKLFKSEPDPSWFGNPSNPSGDKRGWSAPNWLTSRFHFSFAEYSSSKNDSFGVLRVMNDDLVMPKRGFGTHGHANMEICTYVVEGALTHKDSMGTSETLTRGAIQFMTAGTGVRHSEHNLDSSKPLRFIQMWIVPNAGGLAPNYGSHAFERADRLNRWCAAVSPVPGAGVDGGTAPVQINQDACIKVTELDPNVALPFATARGRQAYMLCVEGECAVNAGNETAATLERHDAAEFSSGADVVLVAGAKGAHVLVVEMAERGRSGREDL